jgi:UDP-N-acetylmuramyl tripeptide synthase
VPASAGIERIVDRAEAIAHVLAAAGPRDVVLIAGKGHEATQEADGVKRPFSDIEQARLALAARAGVTC